jgi:thermostable 8-oxoguanine DNA glycosylase
VPLDTHILKFLRTLGLDAPKATPGSRKQYLALEAAFVFEAKCRGKTTRELDTEVWKFYANKPTAERRG